MSLLKKIERAGKKLLLLAGKSVFAKVEAEPGSVEQYKVKKILIVRQDRKLGNLIMVSSLIEGVCRVFPQAHVYLLHGRKLEEVFYHNPQITDRFVFDHRIYFYRPWKLVSLIRQIKSHEFNLVFDSSHPGSLSFLNGILVSISGADLKIGFQRNPLDLFVNVRVKPDTSAHYIKNQLNLVRVFQKSLPHIKPSFYLKEQEIIEGKVYLNSMIGSDYSFLVGIWIGARDNKLIPGEVLDSISELIGEIPGGRTVFLLGPEEKDFSPSNKNSSVLRFSEVRKLAAALVHFDGFISGDTGPLHLAYSLNLKTIGIFNQNNYNVYGYENGGESVIIKPDDTKNPSRLRGLILKTVKVWIKNKK